MNSVRYFVALFVLGCFTSWSAAASDTNPRMLMMDIKATLVDEKIVGLVNNMVSTELAKQKGVELLTGADMRQMVALEIEKQSMGCTDDSSCLSELAGAIGARYVVFGEMGKLGSFFLLTLNLFDSQMAKSVARDTLKVKSIDALVDKVPGLIAGLISSARESGGLVLADPKVRSQKTVFMRDVVLKDGRLFGFAIGHPKLGDGRMRSSVLKSMTYDDQGTATAKSKNTTYIIESSGWRVKPDGHPHKGSGATIEHVKLKKEPTSK